MHPRILVTDAMAARAGELVSSIPKTKSSNLSTTAIDQEIRVDIIDAGQLCGDVADRWCQIRQQNGHLSSPYFDIEFTKAVARVRDDVEIAVIRGDSEEIQSFIAYQRVDRHHAVPVGGRLNDVHGVIGDIQNLDDAILKMMQLSNLKSFSFHASNLNQTGLEKYVFQELDSHFLDIREGWETYFSWARKNSVSIRRQGQKTRKLAREIGPVQVEFDCFDASNLETLIELKRAKYQRSKTFDILSVQWASDLLREISAIQQPGFQGLLSVMTAGDQFVAAHFGMLTDHILHYWFPIFDPTYAKYSPGTELLLSVAREASARGVSKVDLGYGDDAYKFKFCNGRETVRCGRVTTNRFEFALAKQRYLIRQRLKNIPLKPLAKSMLRGVFPGFGQWNFK